MPVEGATSPESPEATLRSATIEVPWELVEAERDRLVSSQARSIKLPGFRRGKAPLAVLNAHLGREIEEALSGTFAHTHAAIYLGRRDLRVAWGPDVKECRYRPGKPLVVRAEFEVFPDFELGDYLNLKVRFEPDKVTDEDVEQGLSALRERQASFHNIDPRPASVGDLVVVSMAITPLDDESERSEQSEIGFELGNPDMSTPAIDELLVGEEPGETVSAETSRPQDFGATGLADRTSRVDITLERLVRRELPDLDDELARDIDENLKTLDDLRERVREGMQAQADSLAEMKTRAAVETALVTGHPNTLQLPERFFMEQMRRAVEAFSSDWAKEHSEDPPHEMIQLHLQRLHRRLASDQVLDRIATVEDISVSASELHDVLAEYAEENDMDPREAAEAFERSGERYRAQTLLRREKAMAFVIAEGLPGVDASDDEAASSEGSEPPESNASADGPPAERAGQSEAGE